MRCRVTHWQAEYLVRVDGETRPGLKTCPYGKRFVITYSFGGFHATYAEQQRTQSKLLVWGFRISKFIFGSYA